MGSKSSKLSKTSSQNKLKNNFQQPLKEINELDTEKLNSVEKGSEKIEILNQHDEKLQNELKVIDPNDLPKVPSLPNVPPPLQNQVDQEELEKAKELEIEIEIEIPKVEEPIEDKIVEEKEHELPKTDVPVGDSPPIISSPNEDDKERVSESKEIVEKIEIQLEPKLVEEVVIVVEEEKKIEVPVIEIIKKDEEKQNQEQQLSQEVSLPILSTSEEVLVENGGDDLQNESKLLNSQENTDNNNNNNELPKEMKRPRPTRKATIGKKLYATFSRKKSQRIQKDGVDINQLDKDAMSITQQPTLKHSDTVGELSRKPELLDEPQQQTQDDYKSARPTKNNSNKTTKYNTISMKFSTFRKKMFSEEELKENETSINASTDSAEDSGEENDDLKKKKKFFNFEMSSFNNNIQKIGQVFLFAPGTMIYGPM